MTLPKTKFPALSSSHLVNLFGIVSSITNATSSGPLNIGMIKKAKHEPSSGLTIGMFYQGSNLAPASTQNIWF